MVVNQSRFARPEKGFAMFPTFTSARETATALAGAFVAAMLCVSAAVPLIA
jgi:hypothetical protein